MPGTIVEMVLQNLLSLLPFVIVKSYQGGVRWRFGKNPTPLSAGVHWKLWVLHQVDIYDMCDEVLDLPVQSIVTKDGQEICFSVNVAFRVVDVVKHGTAVQDFKESTAGIAMTHLAQRVRDSAYSDLIGEGGLKKLEQSLENTLTTRMKPWGSEVFSVGFTNFVPVRRQMRIFLDSHTQGVLAPPSAF